MKFVKLFLFLTISVFLLSFALNREASTISIIVNKDNPVTTLTASEVKLYWLRKIKKRWPEFNKNIKPADRKTSCAEKDIFYSSILKMSASDVDGYFAQKQYENAEKPQDKFAKESEMLEFVESEAGAIGFISSKTSIDGRNVKVVLEL